MQKYNIWETRPLVSSVEPAEDIIKEYNFDSNMARILKSKGLCDYSETKQFLCSDYKFLTTPFLFSDMSKALNRIHKAIKNNETVYIYGDYDADGIMGTCILYKLLSKVLPNIHYMLPNRFKSGYGLNPDIINELKEAGADLIITVDNGISAIEEIKYASDMGIDVIVTDHHECGENLPDAYCILNPKKAGENYPYTELCGASVALKLAMAIIEQKIANYDISELITFAMIGTIADIVPLTKENRIIASIGLNEIKKTKNIALIEMMNDAGINPHEISCSDIGFKIAPRINAAGRMTDANETIKMFCSFDRAYVKEKVSILSEINRFRQAEEKKIFSQADGLIRSKDINSNYIWVLSSPNWHEGIIGISAGRLAEEYNRPFILISENEDIAKGSARSIPGFNIFNAIKNSSELLVRYGGHSAAAGFSIKKENIEEFRSQLNRYAAENGIQKVLYAKKYYDFESVDGVFTDKFIEDIELLSPFGYKNPRPVIRLNNCKITNITLRGQDKSHVSCSVEKNNNIIKSIAFGQSDSFVNRNNDDTADILFTPKINNFNNTKNIEYEIKDIFYYKDCSKDYEKASYKHFIHFYDKNKYAPKEKEFCSDTIEEIITKSQSGEVKVLYSYEMLKRVLRFLRYAGLEKEFRLCFGFIEEYDENSKYILACPLKLPNKAKISVLELNCFNTLEADLYEKRNAVFLNNKYPAITLDLTRRLLGHIYVRLGDISAVCNNKLENFILHLKKSNNYQFDYITVRLAIDIFASLGLVKYNYFEETDIINISKILSDEKKDINKSQIMIKLAEIAN